jgi:hypothetical protein
VDFGSAGLTVGRCSIWYGQLWRRLRETIQQGKIEAKTTNANDLRVCALEDFAQRGTIGYLKFVEIKFEAVTERVYQMQGCSWLAEKTSNKYYWVDP